MDFKTFTAQHFNGDEIKAHQHLVNESYYHTYSLTESRENLQQILDTMTREEAKLYMRCFREAVKKDPDQEKKTLPLCLMLCVDRTVRGSTMRILSEKETRLEKK